MASHRGGVDLRPIRTLYKVGAIGGLSDGQLLEKYTTRGGEAAEMAFEALLDRHGPMVLRVCRSVLRDEHDARDAFQATFLVLLRRAGSLWVRDSLGPWLYQVALRVARCARAARARRRRHERTAAGQTERPGGDAGHAELASILHDEIGRLPERDRAVIVLCCLEGLTQEKAARQLGCPIGTVQSRLARGRARLGSRLARRGLAPSVGLLGAAMAAEKANAAVPPVLREATARALAALAAGRMDAAGMVQTATIDLMKRALRTMFLLTLKRIAAALMAMGVVATGAGVLARQGPGNSQPSPPRELATITMPPYVVEPPDLIRVEMQEALPGRPITGDRVVQPDGTISLGYYGAVYVAGLTVAEIKEKVIDHLRKHLGDESLGLVAPDPDHPGCTGTVAPIDSTRLYVEISAYNSQRYYVQGAVAAPGRLPITGNDTVLDAINYAGGILTTASSPRVRLVRPPARGAARGRVLDVDYKAIVYEGDPTTNYQILPGDRLIVFREPDHLHAIAPAVFVTVAVVAVAVAVATAVYVARRGRVDGTSATGRGVGA